MCGKALSGCRGFGPCRKLNELRRYGLYKLMICQDLSLHRHFSEKNPAVWFRVVVRRSREQKSSCLINTFLGTERWLLSSVQTRGADRQRYHWVRQNCMHVMPLKVFNLCYFLDDHRSVQNGITITCCVMQTNLAHVTVTSEASLMIALQFGLGVIL